MRVHLYKNAGCARGLKTSAPGARRHACVTARWTTRGGRGAGGAGGGWGVSPAARGASQEALPEAISSKIFAKNRTQIENIKVVIDDILGHGNDSCLLPGQLEANFARRSETAGGLLFSEAEVDALNEIAHESGVDPIDKQGLATVCIE